MGLDLDPGWARLIWEVGLTILMGALAISQWLLSREQVSRDKLTALRTELTTRVDAMNARLVRVEEHVLHIPTGAQCAGHVERMTRIEATVSANPTHKDLADIYAVVNPLRESIAGLRADVQNMGEAMRGIRHGIESLTESLLRRDEAKR